MKQEDKDLLLKDLCARLPYVVAVRCTDSDTDYKCFLTTDILHEIQNGYEYYDYKPYLRSMSSMTEEERKYYIHLLNLAKSDRIVLSGLGTSGAIDITDYLISHHFDYRDLIGKGLAIEAPEGMYKTE